MKTKLPLLRLLTAVAAGATLIPRLAADVDSNRTVVTTHTGLRTTTKDEYRDHGFDKLRGTAVRGADGKNLGDIRDLVLDARSGEVRFVAVSGGGFGHSGGIRLLPVGALISDPNEKGFLTRLQRVDWELLPALEKADIKEGRIGLTSDQRRNLSQLREQDWAKAFDRLAERDTDPRVQRFVFASALDGKALYAEDQKVGKVDDVYVDLSGRPAMAVVQIDRDYTDGTEHEFLVPIGALQVPAGENGRVHTTLADAEFRRAAGLTPLVTDGRPWVQRKHRDNVRVRDTVEPRRDSLEQRRDLGTTRVDADVERDRRRDADVVVVPTGQPSGFNADRAQNDTLSSAARSIRQYWERDAELKRYNLTVTPEGDHLVLGGTVPTRALAERAEDAADDIISHINLVNRIHIDDARR